MPNLLPREITAHILNHQQMEQELTAFKHQAIEPPYFFSLRHGGQYLYYIGAKHSHDPQDGQNAFIQSKWQEFRRTSLPGKRVAVVEGGIRATPESYDAAITKDGEAGLTSYLAHQADVKMVSPEPSYKDQIELLSQQFSRDEIAYYYFARIAWQYHRLTQKPSFETYIQHFANLHRQRFGWDDYDFSLPHMITLHNQSHDHLFSPSDVECFKTSSHPAKSPVPDALSTFRDQSIVQTIYAIWQKGDSIFVVYGAGHYITQKPALQAMLLY